MSLELLIAIVGAVLAIVFSQSLSSRIGVAGPLILVALGVGISLIPAVPAFEVQPEIILMGVLPPLLFSAAVSAPAIEFRRDIAAIGGLSVALVIISSLVLGLLFFWAIPGLGFPLAVALGAILSPTDAVATSIVRKLGVPRRVTTVLEGESLLNDATALVLLRTAVIAAASGFSFFGALGSLAWAVLSAIVIGVLAGVVSMRLRAWTTSPTANTALGLTVPFLAYIPTEAVGGSGLVAAVVAGIVTGQASVRYLTPEQRISDRLTWRTIEFVLEGAVFLIMGLELFGIVQSNLRVSGGLVTGIGIAAMAFVVLLIVRAAYVMPAMSLHARSVRRTARRGVAAGGDDRRTARRSADLAYFEAFPLTWKHNTVIVWAGMRGAVTLAAAQTLARDTPERDLLVFIAFLVAAGSLLIQGLTLPVVVRVLRLRADGAGGPPRAEIRKIDDALRRAARAAVADGTLRTEDDDRFSDVVHALPFSRLVAPPSSHDTAPDEVLEFELALIAVMRQKLHQLGRSGRFSTGALRYVLEELDAYEISVRLHLESEK